MTMKTAGLLLAIFAVLLFGCSGEQGESSGDHDQGKAEEGHTESGMSEGGAEAAAAAKLPPGANTTCPVSGDEVLSDSFFEYKGKKIYLCCDDCVKKVKADPETYFSKAYPDAGRR